MNIVIGNTVYKIPGEVIEHNSLATSHYNELFLYEIFKGEYDFDRIESENGDFLESECFEAYANLHNIDESDANISDVSSSMYAIYMDYKKEDYRIYCLEKESTIIEKMKKVKNLLK